VRRSRDIKRPVENVICLARSPRAATTQRNSGNEAESTIASFCATSSDQAEMIAPKPRRLNHLQAASVPVVAVTAWQMLFEHARLEREQSAMVLGAAGNVGTYAVQVANSDFHVIAVVAAKDVEHVRTLGLFVLPNRLHP